MKWCDFRRAVAWIVVGWIATGGAAAHPLSERERTEAAVRVERFRHDRREGAAKPDFDEIWTAVRQEALARRSLRETRLLYERWGEGIHRADLQAEIDRIIARSKDPAALDRLIAALDGDAERLAEVVARPLVVERRLRRRFFLDPELHAAARRAAEEFRAGATAANFVARAGAAFVPVELAVGRTSDIAADGRTLVVEPDAFAAIVAGFPPVGSIGSVETRDDAYVVRFTAARSGDRFVGGLARFARPDFAAWRTAAAAEMPAEPPSTDAQYEPSPTEYRLPLAPAAACAEGWLPSALGDLAPDPRFDHSAIWTGSEMIVWGGRDGLFSLRSGAIYDPVLDTWQATSVAGACPSARFGHSAVWTGSEMIVWGGTGGGQSGGRYDPSSDTWAVTTLVPPVPSARSGHTAVWTGTDMIVWGGLVSGSRTNTGGRYRPATNTWSLTSVGTNVPTARDGHSAVAASGEMIVWGGETAVGRTNTGARYQPLSNSWTPLPTLSAPTIRRDHAAVWTGSQMLIWGGADGAALRGDGARYDLGGDAWAALGSGGSPPTARRSPLAAWSGSELLIWGGDNGSAFVATGARLSLGSGTWVPLPAPLAPSARSGASGVFADARLIVWGGADAASGAALASGARYSPSLDAWSPTGTGGPSSRRLAGSVWTGNEWIVWGGIGPQGLDPAAGSGGRYDPVLDVWSPTTRVGAPTGRFGHSQIWTGRQMLVWSGLRTDASGGRYDPIGDSWQAMSMAGAPAARDLHSTVWSGKEMVVWGGRVGAVPVATASGGKYDAYRDLWSGVAATATPSARFRHAAAWGEGFMTIWGGDTGAGATNDGGRYAPTADAWSPLAVDGNTPSARSAATAVWSGSDVLVWGGSPDGVSFPQTGGRYDPTANAWQTTATLGAPAGRSDHSALWAGAEMIVWGGADAGSDLQTGGRYDALADTWQAVTTAAAPEAREEHSAAWIGTGMVAWGGDSNLHGTLADGGLYVPSGALPEISGADVVCLGLNTTLDAGPGYTNYSWSTGATTQTILVAPTEPTTYSCRVTTGGGCDTTRSKTVWVTVPYGPEITGITNICSGTVTTLTAAAGFTGYQWRLEGAPIGGETGTNYTTSAAGNYSVSATDALGCPSTSPIAAVTIGNFPPPAVGFSLRVTKGGGANLVFTWQDVSNATGYEVRWDALVDGTFTGVVGSPVGSGVGTVTATPDSSAVFFRTAATNGCGTGPLN